MVEMFEMAIGIRVTVSVTITIDPWHVRDFGMCPSVWFFFWLGCG